ncbi:MAG TPA: beta-propeller domain-containing protein [Micromonosporaceae bacterium]|nr:beta-propeller domain-containing protein [Micromonosporaceae bacterium]
MTATKLAAGVVLAAGLVLSAGCSDGPTGAAFRDPAVPAGSFQLVSFTSCNEALDRLKEAARQYVGPWGIGSRRDFRAAGGGVAQAEDAAAAPAAPDSKAGAPGAGSTGSAPGYSGTNTHEAGVDEPDLVKTDGRRIVTVSQGVLRVIDAAGRRLTGELNLQRTAADPVRWGGGADLLLHGDRALVLVAGGYHGWRGGPGIVEDMPGQPRPGTFAPDEIAGPRLLLVDLAGAPRLLGSYTVDGSLVDARQVGGVVRVVVRSAPRLAFPTDNGDRSDTDRVAANRAVIDKAGLDDWLPRYQIQQDGRTTTGRVGCDAVSRPALYTGTSMVTVLSFDLGGASLQSGDPVTVVADGDTVYSNGTSLYVANDQRWRAVPANATDAGKPVRVDERTELYKFDTAGSGRPRHVASGSVPGWLLNQYSLSEWDGHLRVATTTGQFAERAAQSSSAVYVLAQRGRSLVETGKVTGLGKGERIYAVRFVGPVGYVVTFRQTDPLYTLDLGNPRAPRTLGELKITGYSAYLHPAGDGRLIGIGQEATAQGRVQGTQVSLFDVSDLARPTRLAQYHAKYGHSEAEFDPHAFLYWPQTGLLVVPLNVYSRQGGSDGGALVLQVSGTAITEIGLVTHDISVSVHGTPVGQIRRSLMIDDVLWTVSEAGAKASDARTLATLGWLPFR